MSLKDDDTASTSSDGKSTTNSEHNKFQYDSGSQDGGSVKDQEVIIKVLFIFIFLLFVIVIFATKVIKIK